MNKKKWITLTAVSSVIILAVLYGFIPKPAEVDTVKAFRGTMTVTVDEEGTTRVKERFTVSAPVAGFMKRIELKVGDRVVAGRSVALIEPLKPIPLDARSRAEAEAAVKAAQAALKATGENSRIAEAQLQYSKSKLEKTKALFDSGFASKDVIEQAESDLKSKEAAFESSKAAIKVAAHELDRAGAVIEYSSIKPAPSKAIPLNAPIDGFILKLHRESEGAVTAGELLIDIGDTAGLEVRAEVLSIDAVKIKPGIPVIFERWGGEASLSGVVRTVEPSAFTKISSLGVEEQRVIVIADITSPPAIWKDLGDGFRLESRFVLWEGKNVLQVPSSSIFRAGEGWALFAVENKRAVMRNVQIGRRNGLMAEILAGLTEGDTVINHPDNSIKNGVRIKQR